MPRFVSTFLFLNFLLHQSFFPLTRAGLRTEGEREEEEKMGVKTKAKEEKNSCNWNIFESQGIVVPTHCCITKVS